MKNPWKIVFLTILLSVGYRAISGIFSSDEEAVRVHRSAPAPLSDVVPPAAAAEPAPPVESEPEKVDVWSGECYSQSGTKLWFGKATNISSGDQTSFYDESTGGKRVDIHGAHNCIWRFELERNKRSEEQ